MNKKKLSSLLIMFILSLSFVFASDFMPEDKPLSFFSTQTVTGISRNCADYPTDTGIVQKGYKSLTGCGGYKDLYNIYEISASSGNWKFITEKSAPTSFTWQTAWAYECYACPEPDAECVEGAKTCISDAESVVCSQGQFRSYDTCASDEVCRGGSCIAVDCVETWSCGEWSDCVGGFAYRDCVDFNGCGTKDDKPISKTTCTDGVLDKSQGLERDESSGFWLYSSIILSIGLIGFFGYKTVKKK